MKLLAVGDVHATPEELDDCRKLVELVAEVGHKEKVDATLLLGDQHHTHNVMRLEVMGFWKEAFESIRNPWALIGNHDYAGEGSSIHAMMAYQDQVNVIDQATMINSILLMPYFSDSGRMVQMANCGSNAKAKTLICHQTFEGSKYENGFYAPDGIDQDILPQETIISGHIHRPQSFGKVTYIGAPRWRSLSDANTKRSIVLYDFDLSGRVRGEPVKFDTSTHCREIRHVVDSPDAPIDYELSKNCDWRIDIRGPEDWVEKRRVELAQPGIRVRTFSTHFTVPAVRESEGIDTAFNTYLKTYVAKYGTPPDRLEAMAKERLSAS